LQFYVNARQRRDVLSQLPLKRPSIRNSILQIDVNLLPSGW
jgi:hypothetical protein